MTSGSRRGVQGEVEWRSVGIVGGSCLWPIWRGTVGSVGGCGTREGSLTPDGGAEAIKVKAMFKLTSIVTVSLSLITKPAIIN